MARSSSPVRRGRSRKRKPSDSITVEKDESSFSASHKKLKHIKEHMLPVSKDVKYDIVNFDRVFSEISEKTICKKCSGKLKFKAIDTCGLGFTLAVICKCGQRDIPSCNYDQGSYDINKRFIFIMSMLGVGLKGCEKFCALMDIPASFSNIYNTTINEISECVKTVFDRFTKVAVKQEKQMSKSKNKNDFTVSGNCSWRNYGFNSLYGVASLIGYYTGKIVDVAIKHVYCKACGLWTKKLETAEYEDWIEEHEPVCAVKSTDEIEVDAMKEMFERSQELHGVKYANYIGDPASKTTSAIAETFDDVKNEKIKGPVQRNRSYCSLLWKTAPNDLTDNPLSVQTAAYVSAGIFNESQIFLLKVLEALGVKTGQCSQDFATKRNTKSKCKLK